MSLTSEHAALRVLNLIRSPLLDVARYDTAYDALIAADEHMGALSSGETKLLSLAWQLYLDKHPLGNVDADNAAAVLRVLAERYAPRVVVTE